MQIDQTRPDQVSRSLRANEQGLAPCPNPTTGRHMPCGQNKWMTLTSLFWL